MCWDGEGQYYRLKRTGEIMGRVGGGHIIEAPPGPTPVRHHQDEAQTFHEGPITHHHEVQLRTKSTVWNEVEVSAKQMREVEPSLTIEQARVRVLDQNPELYREWTEAPDEKREEAAKATESLPERLMGAATAEAMKPIKAEARRLREQQPALSEAQAFTEAITRNPKMYDAYLRAQEIDENVEAKTARFMERS